MQRERPSTHCYELEMSRSWSSYCSNGSTKRSSRSRRPSQQTRKDKRADPHVSISKSLLPPCRAVQEFHGRDRASNGARVSLRVSRCGVLSWPVSHHQFRILHSCPQLPSWQFYPNSVLKQRRLGPEC